jgi:phosphoribosylaminoimidazole-succinocarboxamide synthase
VRQWLIENDFQGLEGQIMPDMPDEFVDIITERYIELYEKIIGKPFEKADNSNIEARIEKNVVQFLKEKNLI